METFPDILPVEPTRVHVGFQVNGESVEVAFAPHKTLLEVLREDLGLTGTKHGCELGECGTCAVLVDGKPVLSCLYLGLECAGRRVETVEGEVLAGAYYRIRPGQVPAHGVEVIYDYEHTGPIDEA